MTELAVISETQNPLFDVVFVHGYSGDSRASWTSEAGYWPEWIAEGNPAARVSAVDYSFGRSIWRKSMPLADHAVALLELLIAHDVGARPIVFIGHSLGGVVVKELLRQATMMPPMYRSVWDHTAAVVFLATPVALASMFQNQIVKIVGLAPFPDNHVLQEANRFYRDRAPRKGITTLSFAAARSVLVEPSGSDPGVPDAVVIPVDASDIDVAKPKSRSSLVVVSVQRLLRNVHDLIVENRLPTTGTAGND